MCAKHMDLDSFRHKDDHGQVPGAVRGEEPAEQEPMMRVKIYSPYKTYFDEAAYSISAVNETGPFDILPKHHNFITLLSACVLVIRGIRSEQKIRISGGLMHVKADDVKVFLDI
jgi:F0F1-type ATP synthase epsilon subunit